MPVTYKNSVYSIALLLIFTLFFVEAGLGADTTKVFDIPASPAYRGLNLFAQQADIQILYPYDQVKDLQINRLQGEYTLEEGMRTLIDGTCLQLSEHTENAMALDIEDNNKGFWFMKRNKINCNKQGVLSALSAAVLSSLATASAHGQEEDYRETPRILEEIVVTGTLIRGIAPAGSSVIGLSQAEVEASGAGSANLVLATLMPQISNFFGLMPTGVSAAPGGNASNAIGRPNLRQLPGGNVSTGAQTLVLIDGHRVVSAGTEQFAVDADILAANAIGRIEALVDGGSAVYGSDALGGVLNFITLDGYEGLKVSAGWGVGKDYESYDGSILAGTKWDGGGAYIAYSRTWHSDIYGANRDFVKRIDWATGIPAGRNCASPNVLSGGTNYIVSGEGLAQGVSVCDPSDDTAIYPKKMNENVFAKVSQQLTDTIDFDMSFLWANRDIAGSTGALGAGGGTGGIAGSATVTSASPFYRDTGDANSGLNQTVTFNYGPFAGFNSERQETGLDTWNIAPGLRFELGRDWVLNTLVSYGKSEVSYKNNIVNLAAQNSAINDGLLNPYDILSSDPAVLREITSGVNRGYGKGELQDYRAILDGPVFAIPGGDVRVAVGAEHIVTGFERQTTNTSTLVLNDPINYTQRVNAVFGEIQVPLISPENAKRMIDEITISFSIRHDRYNDFGETTNPKFGITYRPVDWLAFRGNWGKSFNAPSPVDQLGTLTSAASVVPPAFLQLPPGLVIVPGETGVSLGGGSATGLQPQKAESWSIGLNIQPPSLPGLTFDVSYYEIDVEGTLARPIGNGTNLAPYYRDYPDLYIVRPTGQQLSDMLAGALGNPDNVNFGFDNPGSSSQATVNGGVPVAVALNTLVRNLNQSDGGVSGIDFSTSYVFDGNFATYDARIGGNYLTSGESTSQRFRVSTSLGMTKGPLRAQATWRHRAGFNRIDPMFGQRRMSDFDIVDLYFRYDVNGSGLASNLAIKLNIQNLLDKDNPEYRLNGQAGYDLNHGFTLGRVFQFGVEKEF